MIRRLQSFVILLLLLCLGYFGYRVYEDKGNAAVLKEETILDAIPTVAIISPKPVPSAETIELPGNLVGWYEAPIYARVAGYVKEWHKDYGDYVEKGDVLAEINTPDLDAEYQQARADLKAEQARFDLASTTAQRWAAMRASHAVSEQSITIQEKNMKTQAAVVQAAEQKVKNIEAFIGFKKIVAPFRGVVTQRNINVGDLVSKEGTLSIPNATGNLFTVAVIEKLRLFVSVPESFGPFLKTGMTADVTVPQLPHRHWTAQYLTVSRGFDVGTRTATTVFTIDNSDHALWPGSYAQVHLAVPVDPGTLTIPSTALVFQEHGTQVAIVGEGNLVHLQPIHIVKLMDNAVEVKEGISPSDRIVNNPSAALLEGDKVRVVTPAIGYDQLNGEIIAPKEPPSQKS